MTKSEIVATAAKTLLESVSASFARVARDMHETSVRLDATLGRIKAVRLH